MEMFRDMGTSHVSLRFLRCVEKTECVLCCGVEWLECVCVCCGVAGVWT